MPITHTLDSLIPCSFELSMLEEVEENNGKEGKKINYDCCFNA